MQEACYCGRTGEIEDREPVLDADDGWALRCPDCGHTDYLQWLPVEAGLLLWREAIHRRGIRQPRQWSAA